MWPMTRYCGVRVALQPGRVPARSQRLPRRAAPADARRQRRIARRRAGSGPRRAMRGAPLVARRLRPCCPRPAPSARVGCSARQARGWTVTRRRLPSPLLSVVTSGLLAQRQVDDPALVRRHRLEHDRPAAARDLPRHPLGQADQRLLAARRGSLRRRRRPGSRSPIRRLTSRLTRYWSWARWSPRRPISIPRSLAQDVDEDRRRVLGVERHRRGIVDRHHVGVDPHVVPAARGRSPWRPARPRRRRARVDRALAGRSTRGGGAAAGRPVAGHRGAGRAARRGAAPAAAGPRGTGCEAIPWR